MKLFQKLINLVKQLLSMQVKSALNGKTINLTGDNTIIKSTNFNVDKNGNMSCNNMTANNVKIQGGKIKLDKVGADLQEYFKITDTNGDNFSASSSRLWLNRGTGGTAVYIQGGYLDQAAIALHDKDGSDTSIYGNGIVTPRITQTSLVEHKKNFEKMQDNALEIIKNIDIYKYNLKNEKDTDKKHIGFVIGDNYNYSKEVTSIDNKGVDNYSFTSLCCKAIQEQQEEIEELKKEIEKLKGGK